LAIKDNGAGDFKVGSYTGDGQASHNITGLGFQPDMVWVVLDDTPATPVWKTKDVPSYWTPYFLSAINKHGVQKRHYFSNSGWV